MSGGPESSVQLDPAEHDWLREGPARTVMDALLAARPGGARYVGGCVRNALIGAPVADVDIATQLTPDQAAAALKDAGLKSVPTGIDHGTVTAVADGVGVEVTTLRRDVETDGRRAVVAFTEDWAEDSARRDFRLNAIYCGADGTLFDPQGGIEDAREGRIVFIGDAGARIAEDALRILRFFRLHAQYGRGRPDRDGLLACARAKTTLENLSGERVWAELKKLFAAAAPEATLRWMQTAEILRVVLGPCDGLEAAAQLSSLRREHSWPRDPVLMLVALTGADENRGERLAETLRMSRAERAALIRFARITCAETAVQSSGDEKISLAAPEQLYRNGAAFIADTARLCWSRDRARAALNDEEQGVHDDAYSNAIAIALSWTSPEFPLSGKDLQDVGFTPGKMIGDVLSALETRWIESKFTLTKSELMTMARGMAV